MPAIACADPDDEDDDDDERRVSQNEEHVRGRNREKKKERKKIKETRRGWQRMARVSVTAGHYLHPPSYRTLSFSLYIYIFFFSSFFCLFASPHRTEAIVRPEDRTWRVEWPLNAVRVRRSFSFSLSLALPGHSLYRVARNTRSAIRER